VAIIDAACITKLNTYWIIFNEHVFRNQPESAGLLHDVIIIVVVVVVAIAAVIPVVYFSFRLMRY